MKDVDPNLIGGSEGGQEGQEGELPEGQQRGALGRSLPSTLVGLQTF